MTGLRRSLSQFATNPLRTFLTLLGIVFGVGSVVAMVSVGEGAQEEILATIDAMGATTTHIQAKDIPEAELGEIIADSQGLTRADASAIAYTLEDALAVAYRRTLPLEVTDLPIPPHEIELLAVSPEIFGVHNLRVAQGRPLAWVDDTQQLRTVVLGAKLARRAFDSDPVGRMIRLDYAFFEVVGVLADRADVHGDDLPVDPQIYEDAILVPYATALQELRPATAYNEVDLISVQAGTTEGTLTMKAALGPVLRDLHGGETDFDIVAPEEILRQREAAQSVLNLVLISIAAISLIVGGIGIMNIMLANIMERISEIGLRRAIGARRADIRNQFLFESTIISVVGGFIGLALGLSAGAAVAFLADIPFAFAWESMLLSFFISVAVGVVFGLVPAVRASRIDPIEALHSE
jgi:putative ABC transport system permease protein